jgi:CDP-2,3-bis-(O-geranylgeranyl)-sn-glycerol synthase
LVILQLTVLLTAANGAPVLATRLLGSRLAFPLDGGLHFIDGRRCLGDSKTVRGVLASLLATSGCAVLVDMYWTTGALVATGAMIGDSFSSFIKRRLGLPPSSRATGIDQLPECLTPLAFSSKLLGLDIVEVAWVTVVFFLGEIALSRVLHKLHLRDRPY